MKKLLLALVLLLSLAGTAGAAPAAPPQSPADGPDLTLMALGLTDYPTAKVDSQRYISAQGTIAAYERDLVLKGGPLAFLSDEVDLYAQATKAQSDAAAFRRFLNTRAGRKSIANGFAQSFKASKVKRVLVSTPASISAGEFAFRFSVTLVTAKATVRFAFVLVRVHRTVGFLSVLARKGARIPAAGLVGLARSQAAHFRTGFTIGAVAPPAIAGTAAQGQTLTADRGRWSGGPDQFTYQWKRCDAAGANCVDIPGATTATYVVSAADAGFTLGVRAQATNPLSTMAADSALTAVVT
jgi:hypothetical protein